MPSSTLLHVPGQQTLDERSVVKLFLRLSQVKKSGSHIHTKGVPGWPNGWGFGIVTAVAWLQSLIQELPRTTAMAKKKTVAHRHTCAGFCSRHMAVPWTARSSSENTWFGWEWPLRPDPTPFATGINWGNWDPNQAVHVWHILGHTLEKKFKDSC